MYEHAAQLELYGLVYVCMYEHAAQLELYGLVYVCMYENTAQTTCIDYVYVCMSMQPSRLCVCMYVCMYVITMQVCMHIPPAHSYAHLQSVDSVRVKFTTSAGWFLTRHPVREVCLCPVCILKLIALDFTRPKIEDGPQRRVAMPFKSDFPALKASKRRNGMTKRFRAPPSRCRAG